MGALKFIGKDDWNGNKNTCAYLETESKLTIIDCGYTVFNEIKDKFDFRKFVKIDIIITSLGDNHVGSLSRLLQYLWYNHKRRATVICKCKHIKEYLDITGTPEETYVLKQKTVDVFLFPSEYRTNLDTYGLRLKIDKKYILYTGETNKIETFLAYVREIDELYIDISRYGKGHLKIDEMYGILEIIKSYGIEVHLMNFDDEEYIKKATKGKFYM